jgi:hypothetical protein
MPVDKFLLKVSGKMKKRLSLFILMTVLLFPESSTAQTSPFWTEAAHHQSIYQDLHNMEGRAPANEIFAHVTGILNTSPDIQNLRAILVFLSENSYTPIHPENMNIGFFLLYSDTFFALSQRPEEGTLFAQDLQNALSAALLFNVMAMSDAARCTNTAAWPAYRANVLDIRLTRLQPAFSAFSSLSYKSLMDKAFAYDEAHLSRPVSAELCPAGQATLDPYTWYEKRSKLHEKLRAFWSKLYEDSTHIKLN